MSSKKMAVIAIAAFALAARTSGDARAGNLVQNGGFETYTNAANVPNSYPTGAILGTNGSMVADWTSSNNPNTGDQGGNFLYLAGTGSSADGSWNSVTGQGVAMWGPFFGVNNGFPATSPAGGNFIGMEGDLSYFGVLSQTINGLTPGQLYGLNFYYAGAEEYPFGATATLTAALAVSFGSDNLVTPTLSYPNAGFTGWTLASMVFVANSTSETLSFMSLSTPNGYPPFVLLDGVTMSSVPEPSALLLVAVGLVGVGGFRKARRLCRRANAA